MIEPLKYLFLNVQTLNTEKLNKIIEFLLTYDVILMSEINNRQLLMNNIDNSVCQYHFDPETPRLAMICRNSIRFTYTGIGLKFDQDREQVSQTIVQTNVYRFTLIDNRVYEVENVYIAPDCLVRNYKVIANYFDEKGRALKMYMAGGDFNMNWAKPARKIIFQIYSMTQMMKDFTRVSNFRNRDGIQSKSETIIDLLFCNAPIKHKILKVEVLKTDNMLNDRNRKFFDHYGISVDISFPKNKPYREVLVPRDPFRRPEIDETIYSKLAVVIYLLFRATPITILTCTRSKIFLIDMYQWMSAAAFSRKKFMIFRSQRKSEMKFEQNTNWKSKSGRIRVT